MTGAEPSAASVHGLHVVFFAFPMRLSVSIMVLAVTGMCCHAAFGPSDRGSALLSRARAPRGAGHQ